MKSIFITLIFSVLSFSFLFTQDNFIEKQDDEIDFEKVAVIFNRKHRINIYYLNGELYTGCVRQNVEEGEMYILHFVKNGKLERQVGYYANGQKSRNMSFKAGYEHGTIELFFPDGTPYIREEYRDGRLHGSLQRWKNGQLVREADFWHGTMIKEKLYDVPGEEKQERPFYEKGC